MSYAPTLVDAYLPSVKATVDAVKASLYVS
jgi:hypothetical protein